MKSTMGYKISDVFGRAPVVYSDTTEEHALREVPWVFRQRAREHIWKNQSDWGFYRTSRTDPRKGEPKRGFAVGTIQELSEQAKKGGNKLLNRFTSANQNINCPIKILILSLHTVFLSYIACLFHLLSHLSLFFSLALSLSLLFLLFLLGSRLPGLVSMKLGSHIITTEYDMSELLVKGQYLRLRDRIFVVVGVTDDNISCDQNWTEISEPTNEPLFLLPSFGGEKSRLYFKFKHKAYDLVHNNSVYQAGLSLYNMVMQRWATQAVEMSILKQSMGKLVASRRFMKKAKQFATNAQWAESRKVRDVDVVDLANQISPKERARKAAEDKIRDRMEYEKAQAELKSQKELEKARLKTEKQAAKKAKKEQNKTKQVSVTTDGTSVVKDADADASSVMSDLSLSSLGVVSKAGAPAVAAGTKVLPMDIDEDEAEAEPDADPFAMARSVKAKPKTKKLMSKEDKKQKALEVFHPMLQHKICFRNFI